MRTAIGLCSAVGLALAGCGPATPDAPVEAVSAKPHSPTPAAPFPPTADGAERTLAAANKPPVGACHLQDGKVLHVEPRRAIGTEPFWSAQIDGRCVTYSTPENARGTRVWTRYHRAASGEVWSGALNGRFELKLQDQSGCSDGMSDLRYPSAAQLLANGERRTGCAKPLQSNLHP